LDGYQFGDEYMSRVSEGGLHQLLVIDDYRHADRYPADIVLNQNVMDSSVRYGDEHTGAELLLGPSYALLRPEFRRPLLRARPGRTAGARRVLVTMGGADPDDMTGKVLSALRGLGSRVDVTVVVGSANPRAVRLQRDCASSGFRCLRDVRDMRSLMDRTDLAVSGGGTTCWELAARGVPSLLIVLADNQAALAEALHKAGAAVCLGWFRGLDERRLRDRVRALLDDPSARRRLGRRARALVDGRGSLRVLDKLMSRALTLRRAGPRDARRLFSWVNDPMVRAASLSPRRIGWDEHLHWCREKLTDPSSALYLAFDRSGEAVGQIRFDETSPGRAEVDVHVAPSRRGRGIGPFVIRQGVRRFFSETRTSVITAFILSENAPSKRAFASAGFVARGAAVRRGRRGVLLHRRRAV
jgi:spore coat polysaccharide biosynthesis predicted glycosyltransferase SpsG